MKDVQLLKEADALRLDPSGFPNRTDSTIAFNDGTLRFTIAPVASTFSIWIKGVEHVKETETVDITDTEGVWYIYYDFSGVLIASQVEWDINNTVQISILYWDAANNKAIIFAEERHGMDMSSSSHTYNHKTVGTRFQEGLAVTGDDSGNGSADSHAQIAVSDGIIYDEDLKIEIVDDPAPSAIFEQILDPIAEIPVYYKDGVAGPWRKKTANTFPVLEGTSRLAYNLDTGGTWTQPDATDNRHVAMWIFASNNAYEPVFALLGQRQDKKKKDADENNTFESLDLTGVFTPEIKLLFRVILKTKASYGNTVHAKVVQFQDYRSVSNMPNGTYVPVTFSSITGKLLNSQLTGSFVASYAKPPVAGSITIEAAKAANGNSAPDAQPVYPVNVRCTLAGAAGSTDVVVTITGVNAQGEVDTEDIAVLGANGDYDGDTAWASISDVAYTGTWDGGNITFFNGTKLGLPHMPIVEVYKEVFDGANQVLGTDDTANGTYIPTGVLNAAKVLEIWYSV